MSDESPNYPLRPDSEHDVYEVIHQCPNCGKSMDSAGSTAGSDKGSPDEGSLMVCYYCSYPSIVAQTTDLTVVLRDPTREEWADILSDEQLLRMFELLRRSRN